MSSADLSLDAFLKNECHLEGDSLASVTAFLKKMGFKTRQQLIEYLPNLSVTGLTKLGLAESQATAIMQHSKSRLVKKQANRMFPRLASKYLTLQVIGYAYVQQEAIDMGFLCINYKNLLIRNFQIFQKNVIQAEKKIIRSVFELLDERWLSKRYRLSYQGEDSERDLIDCFALLNGRLQFHSIEICNSILPNFSKFRPIKMKISNYFDVTELFKNLPSSVTCLNLDGGMYCYNEYTCQLRKFKKLTIQSRYMTLDILQRYATATESLSIDGLGLKQPGVIDYLTQMDCKQIIVKTCDLQLEAPIEFFNCKSKAAKFISGKKIPYDFLDNVEWAFKYFTKKSLEKEILISIDTQIQINDACNLF
ncbi:hypothetical protein FGO68_gene593 [Halteria grandinella]|uniref:Uncharacterized protein n=1 Tax=Halteria grandinella TaxID=5974 RepID=A0A8J8NZY4_HALGN|nr:hypothetical protein FGO68_gene593 [Halteria grandinella]